MKDRTSTGAAFPRHQRTWRVVGSLLLAVGLVLVSPAVTGAQEGDPEQTTTTVEGDGSTETTVPDDETTSTTVVEGEEPAEEPEDEEPVVEEPEEEVDAVVELQGENIHIVQTPDEEQGECNDTPASVLRDYRGGDDEEWHIRIHVDEPLCTPIEATAAIYGMPGNGEAWPQTLIETLDFTLQEAGVTLVTFTKTCDPVQFDVIVGDTPPVIAPLGEWHGPLLFPFDVNTSFQHWGCPPPEVEAVTTLPPAPQEVAPAELALTGTSSTPVAAGGAALLLAGAALLLGYRRRSTV